MTETVPVEVPVVWHGSEVLRSFLVPIGSLEPFPGNPRRGDLESVRGSLRRFGQTRPILVSGSRIIAGHHVTLAATEMGWTHVAAIPHAFESDDDARAYLLADNRTHDRGTYDLDLLYEQLKEAQEHGGLDGTGYDDGYVTDLDAQMIALRHDLMGPEEFPALDPMTLDVQHRCPSCGYEWSGNPAPGGARPADDPEPENDEGLA